MNAFSMAAAEQRFGPAAMEAIEKSVAAAPPLTAERREQIRAVFASARPRTRSDRKVPAPRAA
ncbi:hypothetical protein AB0D99_10420 [Streptomyces sp. NPDC047971]|uniref:hypothetical protein n=1 Tax=Streptomyces sp. NPDC047971 TaxID=3154499 RepID=UPI0034093FF4